LATIFGNLPATARGSLHFARDTDESTCIYLIFKEPGTFS